MNKIPKIIHYCWFGPNPLPEIFKKCYESWNKYCPDYQIKFWNEENFRFEDIEYLKKTYSLGAYAHFVDYSRLKIIHDYGGIYLDVDVELIKPLDSLLQYQMYLGYEDDNHINTGLGFGAEKSHIILKELMATYEKESNFIDRDYVFENCPTKDSRTLLGLGFKLDNKLEILNNITLLPTNYLCPVGYMDIKKTYNTDTISVHHFASSWFNRQQNINKNIILFSEKFFGKFLGLKISRKISTLMIYFVNGFYRVKKHGIIETLRFSFKKIFRRTNHG